MANNRQTSNEQTSILQLDVSKDLRRLCRHEMHLNAYGWGSLRVNDANQARKVRDQLEGKKTNLSRIPNSEQRKASEISDLYQSLFNLSLNSNQFKTNNYKKSQWSLQRSRLSRQK